ncbi:MAG: hypothetical protein KJ056_00715 [Acidimicrobiia bacterium]|nr:hypothetical protein [Acidimicrobiia bacterium]MCL4291541.1 hypothetical protein [Acidimicrobiia bacterium]
MVPGTRVEVRSRFERAWARGFEIAEEVGGGHDGDDVRYRIRRRSDGSVLPALFTVDDVREEKRDRLWWI